MKIAVTLLCRNEADIIGRNIEFHLKAGAEFIIVTDNDSDDDTARIVEQYVRGGRVELIREPGRNHDQSPWVTEMARRAALRGADWVINADADEFWWPVGGTLPDVMAKIAGTVDIVEVPRHNFPPRRADSGDGTHFIDRMIYRDRDSVNLQGAPLPSKVMHRAHLDLEIGDGNHTVTFRNRAAVAEKTESIEILHFPLRSYEQFSSKIILGTEALERNTRISTDVGSTWRHIYHQYYKTGRLPDFYREQELTAGAIEKRLADGTLIVDTRLRDFLAAARPRTSAAL